MVHRIIILNKVTTLEHWLLASDLYVCLQRDPVYRGYGLQPVQLGVLSGSGATKAELQTEF